MSRLYLLDTLFHIFRAYHALPQTLQAEDGTPTNALHGVLGILRNLWTNEPITHLAAVFESVAGNFRDELSDDYKATRPPPPPGLKEQVPLVKEACRRLGISTWEVDLFEADDVIGALAREAGLRDLPVTIVSNDKDMMQLLALDGDIELLRIHGKTMERLRREDVPRVLGVEASQVPSYLALVGDSVDNIAGLKGVGGKTAARWLSEFADLDALLQNSEALGSRWGPILKANEVNLRRDLELTTIRTDIDFQAAGLSFELKEFEPGPFLELGDFFHRYALHRYSREVDSLLHPEPTLHDLWPC